MDADACAQLAQRLIDNHNGRTFDAELYTDDATMWHNTDAHDAPIASRQGIRDRLHALVPDFRFDDPTIHAWEDGWVTQYVTRGTLPDGSELSVHTVVVGTIRDGKVARIQEYVDSAQIEPLRAAFRASLAAAQPSGPPG